MSKTLLLTYSLALVMASVPANAGTVTSVIGEFDGPDLTNPTYPQPSLTIGTFTYTIPAGDTITSASVTGFFGTTFAPSTALENLFVAGIPVASCASEAADCWNAPLGVQTPWTYTFLSSQLSALAGGSAGYTVVQTGDFQVESGVTTLTVNFTPEPSTFALFAGGLGLLLLARWKKAVLLTFFATLCFGQPTTWTATSTPVTATISGGPWTLNDGPLVNPTGPGNYCVGGVPVTNTPANVFQPYYFPFISGRGQALRGIFDYRPHDVNEAPVAASSNDGGLTWTFQQMAEQLTTACPGPNTGTSASKTATDNSASANGNDAGLGHPHIITMGGASFLYLLDRSNGHVDSDGLVVHRFSPNAAKPLGALPLTVDNFPAGATTIAQWDFNALPQVVNNTPAASAGAAMATAKASALGMTNNYTYTNPPSPPTVGAVNTDDVLQLGGSSDQISPVGSNNAWRVRGQNPSNGWNLSAPQYSQGAEFDVDTTGHTNIVFQFDWFCTNQGVRDMQIQYTADGSTWNNVGPHQLAFPNGYINQITVNFAALGITSVENNPNFGVRLVSAFDPTLGTYAGATLSATNQPVIYNNNSGNWRFDEVKVLSLPSAATTVSPDFAVHTTGLVNPDGIMAVIPGSLPRTILYISKTLSGAASLPLSSQCQVASQLNGKINQDLEAVRLASTTDGIHFTDLGQTNLTNPTDTTYTGIRYASPNGSIVQLGNGNFGLFFGAGNCLDGDSDAFHAIAYAEASPGNLLNWTVLNGVTSNPIASIAPMSVNGVTYPTSTPVVGATQAFFGGSVYAPMAMYLDPTHVNLIFDGYDAGYVGGSDYSNYRTVGHVVLQIGNNTMQ